MQDFETLFTSEPVSLIQLFPPRFLPQITFTLENTVKLQEALKCPICRQIINNPVYAKCSHRFCKECIQRYVRNNDKKMCPICKSDSIMKKDIKCDFKMQCLNLGISDCGLNEDVTKFDEQQEKQQRNKKRDRTIEMDNKVKALEPLSRKKSRKHDDDPDFDIQKYQKLEKLQKSDRKKPLIERLEPRRSFKNLQNDSLSKLVKQKSSELIPSEIIIPSSDKIVSSSKLQTLQQKTQNSKIRKQRNEPTNQSIKKKQPEKKKKTEEQQNKQKNDKEAIDKINQLKEISSIQNFDKFLEPLVQKNIQKMSEQTNKKQDQLPFTVQKKDSQTLQNKADKQKNKTNKIRGTQSIYINITQNDNESQSLNKMAKKDPSQILPKLKKRSTSSFFQSNPKYKHLQKSRETLQNQFGKSNYLNMLIHLGKFQQYYSVPITVKRMNNLTPPLFNIELSTTLNVKMKKVKQLFEQKLSLPSQANALKLFVKRKEGNFQKINDESIVLDLIQKQTKSLKYLQKYDHQRRSLNFQRTEQKKKNSPLIIYYSVQFA